MTENGGSDADISLRPMVADDKAAILRFAEALPPHDLLFLERDITKRPVVDAWIEANDSGAATTLLAERNGAIAGCAALIQDPFSWSPHLGEVRVLVAEEARNSGLGRKLIEEIFGIALDKGLEKLTARMTPDQAAAITVFEEMAFAAKLCSRIMCATPKAGFTISRSSHAAWQTRLRISKRWESAKISPDKLRLKKPKFLCRDSSA